MKKNSILVFVFTLFHLVSYSQSSSTGNGNFKTVSGKVLDVAVDIRKSSETYGKYQMIELSAENKKIFWIPPGFAHGFLVLEENTVFSYKCSNYYSPESEGTIKWNDKDLKIEWPISNPNVSEKDNVGEDFVNFVSLFE